LRPSTAQAFALVLHELATNAAKYGALSELSGQISVTWELTDSSLILRWSEIGGPPANPPLKSGFGTRVVGATIERQLQGKALFHWRSEGLECILTVPRAHATEHLPIHRPASPKGAAPSAEIVPMEKRRVLLVEDETLVAIMMREMLIDIGFSVVGPLNTCADALEAAKRGGIDCAILDLNLNGEASYPVADELAARAVPFIFVTGYDKETIDRRYASIHVLQKPVDEKSLRQALSTLLQINIHTPVTTPAGVFATG